MLMTELTPTPKVLLVDDDDAVREMMNATLQRRGFEIVTASSVIEALRRITSESFDVLLTDLHMPNPGDGFTLVTAMRHSQPQSLILLVSGHPDVQSAMGAILLEADHIISKPFDVSKLVDLIRHKSVTRPPRSSFRKERVALILQQSVTNIIAAWLVRSQQNPELSNLTLEDRDRAGHLPKLVEDLALRLMRGSATITGSNASDSLSALAHGELRYLQGYTPAMLVQESRMLQVTIFETLQNNRDHLDFSLLLLDVMTIADEVDSQLTQSMRSYMSIMQNSGVAGCSDPSVC